MSVRDGIESVQVRGSVELCMSGWCKSCGVSLWDLRSLQRGFFGYFEVDFQSYPVGQLIDFSRLTGSGVETWPYLFSFSSISRLLLPDDG